MAFAGYLLKVGNDEFPHKYIELSSYDVSPDNREEIKAERDDNSRQLIRVTASGMKSAIHFKTRPNLTESEMTEITSWFRAHETDSKQRRINSLSFWNPDPWNPSSPSSATPGYDSGDFYRANTKFPIKRISGTDLIYDSVEFDLIEY